MLEGMYGCLSTAALLEAGWDCHRIRAAERCCLRRLERGRYVVTAECSDPAHSFVSAIAAAPTTTLPIESTGLRKRVEDLRILVRSYVDRLLPDAVLSHRSALIVHGLPIPYVERDDVFVDRRGWSGWPANPRNDRGPVRRLTLGDQKRRVSGSSIPRRAS